MSSVTLPNDIRMRILYNLDASDSAKLSRTCKDFYASNHSSPHWKRLFIKDFRRLFIAHYYTSINFNYRDIYTFEANAQYTHLKCHNTDINSICSIFLNIIGIPFLLTPIPIISAVTGVLQLATLKDDTCEEITESDIELRRLIPKDEN